MKKAKLIFVLFFLALMLPGILFLLLSGHIDTENHENRAYAEYPETSELWENYENYTSELEAFYNDRIPFKNQLKWADP